MKQGSIVGGNETKVLTRHVLDGACICQGIEGDVRALELRLGNLVPHLYSRFGMRVAVKVDEQPGTAGVIVLDVLTCLLDETVELVVGNVGDRIVLDGLLRFSIRIELNSAEAINDEVTSLAGGRLEFIVGTAGHIHRVFVVCCHSTAVGAVLRSASLGPVAGRRRGIPATMRAIVNVSGIKITVMAR